MPPRNLTSQPTESVINLLDANAEGSLSASDLSRQRILAGGYSLETVTLVSWQHYLLYVSIFDVVVGSPRGSLRAGGPQETCAGIEGEERYP